MRNDHIMLSIKPNFVSQIFTGQKTVELRRIRPKKISADTIILVYTSSPIKTLASAFSIKKIIEIPVDELWEKVKDKSGIKIDEYTKYFEGATHGIGIFIDKIFPLPNPVKLAEMRQLLTQFSPPQSFRYVSTNEFNLLLNQLKRHSIFN